MAATTVEQTLIVHTPDRGNTGFTAAMHDQLFAALELPRERFKPYGSQYVFSDVTAEQISAVTPLLDRWAVTFDIEQVHRYAPSATHSPARRVLVTAYDPDDNVIDAASFSAGQDRLLGKWMAEVVLNQITATDGLAGSFTFAADPEGQ